MGFRYGFDSPKFNYTCDTLSNEEQHLSNASIDEIIASMVKCNFGGTLGDMQPCPGFGLVSINALVFKGWGEGWSDARGHAGCGTWGTDAVANRQSFDVGNTITVGPGVTNWVDSRIQEGVYFSAREILDIYAKCMQTYSQTLEKNAPHLKSMGQLYVDMFHIGHHAGPKFIKPFFTATTPQACADACMALPGTLKDGSTSSGLSDMHHAMYMLCLGQTSGAANSRIQHYIDIYLNPQIEPRIYDVLVNYVNGNL